MFTLKMILNSVLESLHFKSILLFFLTDRIKYFNMKFDRFFYTPNEIYFYIML